jgi:hypothetical protein
MNSTNRFAKVIRYLMLSGVVVALLALSAPAGAAQAARAPSRYHTMGGSDPTGRP